MLVRAASKPAVNEAQPLVHGGYIYARIIPAVLAKIEHFLNKILKISSFRRKIIGAGIPLTLNNLAY
jgi:hypothetical protein